MTLNTTPIYDDNKKDASSPFDGLTVAVWEQNPQTAVWEMQKEQSVLPYETITVDGKNFWLETSANNPNSRFVSARDDILYGEEIKGTFAPYDRDEVPYYTIAPTDNAERGTAYARYGIYYANTSELKLFYQGRTVNENGGMPQTGTATYKGYAIAISPTEINNTNGAGGFHYGLSSFNVDFAKKTLKGTLNDWQTANGTATNMKAVNIDSGRSALTGLPQCAHPVRLQTVAESRSCSTRSARVHPHSGRRRPRCCSAKSASPQSAGMCPKSGILQGHMPSAPGRMPIRQICKRRKHPCMPRRHLQTEPAQSS